MKIVILLSIPFIIFASSETLYTGETLSNSEHMSLHGSKNQRPSVKMKNKRKVHKLHKVDEEQAKTIAREETNEEVISLRLDHRNKHLYYKVMTESYTLIINALDGTIIKKSLKD